MTDFDRNPEALAWARAKVEREIGKFDAWSAQAKSEGRQDAANQWRKFANMLRMRFIGGQGCVIAAFDERRPEMEALLDRNGR